MRSTEQSIKNVMSEVSVGVSNSISDVERHLSQPNQLQAVLERIATRNPHISSCSISYDGETIARDSAHWSRPFLDSTDAKAPMVTYRHPIRNEQGEVVAALNANLSLDFLPQILAEQDSLLG